MASLLGLPRELRDMIYIALIATEEPRPTLEKYFEQRQYAACQYSFNPQQHRTACACLLACNQQIHQELSEAIERAQRKGLTSGKLDCLELCRPVNVSRDGFVACHLTWLRMPVVKTTWELQPESPGWIRSIFTYLQEWYSGVAGTDRPQLGSASTRIGQLWMDLRLQPEFSRGTRRGWLEYFRLGRSIIFALTHILEQGPDLSIPSGSRTSTQFAHETVVDEVVLNVVTESPKEWEGEAATETLDFQVRKLTEIWDMLWIGQWEEYGILLRNIKQVRICVNGETTRTRKLALELERGQVEARHAAARMVY